MNRVIPRQIATISGPTFQGVLYENGVIQSSLPMDYFRRNSEYYNSVMNDSDLRFFEEGLPVREGSSPWHVLHMSAEPEETMFEWMARTQQ